jgi:nucleotide-binding universal stress UspA family protein
MKFLVPTDFSDNAFHSALYALTLAQAKPGSSIHLVHVLTPVLYDPVVIRDIEEEAIKSLEKINHQLKVRCEVCTITHSVEVGETVAEINKTAKAVNPGVIVVGIEDASKARRFLFGSNTISLIREATCPVLVIPETAVFEPPKRIVFATDYYDSDMEALQQLVPIAFAFQSEITMVHIFDEQEEEQSELMMIDFISNAISKTVDYPRLTYRVHYNKSKTEGIRHFCKLMEADLLVLSARKQNVFQKLFRKSVTKDVTYDSEIPLLVFYVHKTHEIISEL